MSASAAFADIPGRSKRRHSRAIFYASVGFMQIYSLAMNVGKRGGQYAPLCGASVGKWPLILVARQKLTGNFVRYFSR